MTLRSIRSLLFRSLRRFSDLVVMALVRPPREKQDVLIVRLDAIGDFVLWLDCAKELRRIYQGQRIVLAANAIWADLATRMHLFDAVWAIDVARFGRSPKDRIGWLARVRRHGFRIAVEPTYSRVPAIGDSLIEASAARERIGSTGDLSNMTAQQRVQADRKFTKLLPAKAVPMMELDRNAEFVSGLRGSPYIGRAPSIAGLGALPASLAIGSPYLVLFPGASAALRRWPAADFADVGNQLALETGSTVVLCGSGSERSLCQSIASEIRSGAINLAGETELWQLVEVIRNAELLVANDTSAVHIAAAVRTRSVCVLGGGHFGRFVPYAPRNTSDLTPLFALHPMPCFGCNWVCTQPHRVGDPVPCIARITRSDVLEVARSVLVVDARDAR